MVKRWKTLSSAKVSIDVAMYSFTDHELAEELVRLAKSGVRVRVYRDWREYEQEKDGVTGCSQGGYILP